LISAHHTTSLDNIAAATGQTVDFVRKDLQNMINRRFFAHAVIDPDTNQIIIGAQMAPEQGAGPAQLEAFTCPGCGATGQKPRGAPGNCDYCGSAIK
jgi:hypothetical protein